MAVEEPSEPAEEDESVGTGPGATTELLGT